MQSSQARTILAAIAIAAVFVLIFWAGRRPAEQATAPSAPPKAAAIPQTLSAPFADEYQRSIAIYNFKKAAQSGPDRGREIFYYKCWFCHNELAKGAPPLKGVFQRSKLLSGRPTTEDGIKDEIREGGAGMAAYKYTLSEADLNDLASYLKEGCCWNSDSPPPNPRYRFNEGD
jgi:mono/diheme cytochrome c family protein